MPSGETYLMVVYFLHRFVVRFQNLWHRVGVRIDESERFVVEMVDFMGGNRCPMGF